MKRHVITLLILLAAIVCYFVGWGEGIIPVVALGLGLEVFFWLRVFRKPGKPS